MAKVTVKMPGISWRDGRPRYNPGPETRRRLKLKSEDLKHPDGSWFTIDEAAAWAAERAAFIVNARQAKAEGRRVPRAPARALGPSIETLAEEFFRSPRVTGGTQGKRSHKGKAANTIKFYRQKLDLLGRHDADLYQGPAAALNAQICSGLYESLWEQRGLASARAVIASMSVVLSWAIRSGRVKLAVNPCKSLAMETPEARLRAATPAEIAQLVAAADLMGRPEIGDMIMLGVWTGQRQADRLAMTPGALADGRLRIRQGKTLALVDFVQAAPLEQRLAAARERRKGWKVEPQEIVVDEAREDDKGQRHPFKASHYAHTFQKIRDAAAAGIEGKLKPMPSLADLRDQDLRDTCVTWLARAGCDPIRIASITGHSMKTVHDILKHYLAAHADYADQAIASLVTWFDKQTG